MGSLKDGDRCCVRWPRSDGAVYDRWATGSGSRRVVVAGSTGDRTTMAALLRSVRMIGCYRSRVLLNRLAGAGEDGCPWMPWTLLALFARWVRRFPDLDLGRLSVGSGRTISASPARVGHAPL
ncbi:hypothetical protein ACLOJK_029290 [Asimina triloba]